MTGRAIDEAAPSVRAGAALVLLISTALTVLMAWPVVRAPRTMIFGHEIVGRHHDPFTVMQQFAAGGAAGPYRQPLTDDVGVALARIIGAIPAYNLVVLITFPLAALSAYLLARYLTRSHAGATVAAFAFAFAARPRGPGVVPPPHCTDALDSAVLVGAGRLR